MFKTILVATDGSNHAMKATEIAVDLADKYGARILLISVYKHYSAVESSHSLVRTREPIESPDAALRELATEAVEAAAALARERGAANVETFVKRGPPARTIVDFAKTNEVDAIAMGSRGLGDVTGLLLGSVSHKVSSLAECTCIMVK